MSNISKNKNNNIKIMYAPNKDHSDKLKSIIKKTKLPSTSINRKKTSNSFRKKKIKNDIPHRGVRDYNSYIYNNNTSIKLNTPTSIIRNRKKNVNSKVLRQQRNEETRVYGESSCKALFHSRPKCIVRAWFIHNQISIFKEILYWMAENHKAYHLVDNATLVKVSGTKHHGGVCFLIKKRDSISVKQWISQAGVDDCVLALEYIGNPYNLGAIMRSCANFNVKGILVNNNISLIESGAAIHTAKGGAEYIQPMNVKNMIKAIEQFRKAGYTIIATSSHRGISLFKIKLSRKVVFVLGHECSGVSDTMLFNSDLSVSIDGTGNVESLNISVATGVILAEWWRQNNFIV